MGLSPIGLKMSEDYGHVTIISCYLHSHSMQIGEVVIWQVVILTILYFLDYSDAFCGM